LSVTKLGQSSRCFSLAQGFLIGQALKNQRLLGLFPTPLHTGTEDIPWPLPPLSLSFPSLYLDILPCLFLLPGLLVHQSTAHPLHLPALPRTVIELSFEAQASVPVPTASETYTDFAQLGLQEKTRVRTQLPSPVYPAPLHCTSASIPSASIRAGRTDKGTEFQPRHCQPQFTIVTVTVTMSASHIAANRNSTPEGSSSLRPPQARSSLGANHHLRASADLGGFPSPLANRGIRPASEVYFGRNNTQSGNPDEMERAAQQWLADIDQYETTLEEMATATLDQDFKDELSAIEQWFRVLSEAERTAALYALLQQTTQVQIRFFIQVLQQMSKNVPMSGVLSPANFGEKGELANFHPHFPY
jgi:hypothetical protein